MATLEDYMPGGTLDPAGGLDKEIIDAEDQQQARQADATPQVDWEVRYKELEQHNSRQAQTLGQQRQMIDEFILNPTPAEPVVAEPYVPPSAEDYYDNPAEAVAKTVEAHPAIAEARQLIKDVADKKIQDAFAGFKERHPDYADISQTSEFRDWVAEDSTRADLYTRGNQYDLSAADALFSYYKADKGIKQMTNQAEEAQAIAEASLESSAAQMVVDAPQYSRTEYQTQYQRANQGDQDAAAWVKTNVAGYRLALAAGNVRD